MKNLSDHVFNRVEHIMVERNKAMDKAVFGEINQIVKDNEIYTTVTLNEKAIVDAVQKQIPQKPKFYDTKFRQRGKKYGEYVTIENAYNCPKCNCTVWETDKAKHCDNCGQALDWEGIISGS